MEILILSWLTALSASFGIGAYKANKAMKEANKLKQELAKELKVAGEKLIELSSKLE